MVDLAQAYSELKSLPDQALQRELAQPSGMLPGFMALSELHERKRLRAGTMPQTPKRPSMAEEYIGSMFPGGQRPAEPPPPPPAPPPPAQGLQSLPTQGPPQGYAGGGIVDLMPVQGFARGGQVGEIEAYIRASALQHGVDPDIAVRVAMSEGGVSNPFRQGEAMLKYGREESFGPFQLHIRQGGLGTRALAAGIDPRTNWKGGIDYALAEAKNRGWGQWYGAAKAGIGKWQGIRGQGGGIYPEGGEAIAYNPTATAGAGAAAASDVVAQQAGDTAAKMTAAESAVEGGGADLSTMLMLAGKFGGGTPQPQPAPMAPQQPAQPVYIARREPAGRRSLYG